MISFHFFFEFNIICQINIIPPKQPYTTKKQLPNKDNCLISFMWCHQESNRGHKDFQSFALPTELWHQLFSYKFYLDFANANVMHKAESAGM